MADGGGLYLRVAPSGAKSWILRTVIKGRRCDLGLGSVTLVSLAEAREQAVHLRKVARADGDPLAERRRAHRWLPTFEEAARQVHAAHAGGFPERETPQAMAGLGSGAWWRPSGRSAWMPSRAPISSRRLGRTGLRARQPRGGCSNGSG